MAIVYEKIKAGDVLYDVHRQRMGNTMMSREEYWSVAVKEVGFTHYPETGVTYRWAIVSWNGNREEKWNERRLEKLHRSIPKRLLNRTSRF